MSMKVNKNGKGYPVGVMPQHYPADRVYLDGDTSKTVQDEIIKKSTGGTFDGNVTIDKQEGTTSTPGYSRLYLGNNKGVGTDKNSSGLIGFYTKSGKCIEIYDYNGDISSDLHLALPNKSGTLVVDQGSVSVTADGVKTYGQLFSELFALVNTNKVTRESKIVVGNVIHYRVAYLQYTATLMSGSTWATQLINLQGPQSGYIVYGTNGNTKVDTVNNVPNNGEKITLYY